MPIENEIGFNPFEDATITTTDFNPWEVTTLSQALEQSQTSTISFEAIHRLRSDLQVSSTFVDRVPKKPKQKPLSKLLDEVAEANKEVFDSFNKIQEEINILEKTKLVELANKHDTLLFLVIGKNYTLEKATEKTKAGYYNTLTQQLIHTIHGITEHRTRNVEDFKHLMLLHVSNYIILNDEVIVKFNVLFEDLYEYYNMINEKKKEKRSLMGREEKKSTVCEDYINTNTRGNGISNTIRFNIADY